MEFIFYFFIFLYGLIIGSFLNVVIYRLETGETVVKSRSHCMHCGHVLEWYDLIPVLSFLALRARCRYCGKKISWQYPMVELSTALIILLILNFKFSPPAGGFNEFLILNFKTVLSIFYYLFIFSSLIVIFVYDLKHYIIPDRIVYSAILVSGIWYLVSGIFLNLYTAYDILNTIFAAFLASGFFLAIVLLTRGRGMGGGDVKLAFLMGLILGWPNILLALFLAFATGAIYGIILMAAKRKTLKSEVPFGPFLVIGTMVAIFWGEEMLKWYTGYLF